MINFSLKIKNLIIFLYFSFVIAVNMYILSIMCITKCDKLYNVLGRILI